MEKTKQNKMATMPVKKLIWTMNFPHRRGAYGRCFRTLFVLCDKEESKSYSLPIEKERLHER